MSLAHLPHVRAASLRVALATVAIVATLYVLISGVVTLIVTRNLTGDIDARLSRALSLVSSRTAVIAPGFRPAPDTQRFGPQLLIWKVLATGEVATNDPTAQLPAQDRTVTDPTTISVDGNDVRVAGTGVGGDHLVIGQSLDSVSQTRRTLILAEVLVGPALLGVVFLGALSIGRRVAAPIELARQRQLEFTADASHELRTPLAVIEAQTTLALQQDRDAAWYRNAFLGVDVESKRIRHLVDDLLWLARFDSTSALPGAEHVDLGVLAQQAVDRFGAIAQARSLTLTVRLAGDSQAVTAPPEWLDRLLGVLLDNACKYSPARGAVDVLVAGTGGRVRLTVDDSGPGIAPSERELIFDRFHRGIDSPGGAGLGLAIADAIVRATGGRWEVGVAAAGGASMSVTWARALAGRREAPAAAPVADAST